MIISPLVLGCDVQRFSTSFYSHDIFNYYLSEDDPRSFLRWSGVRLCLECAELGVGGPPYLELGVGVNRLDGETSPR